MSRIGRQPIVVPSGVTVKIDANNVTVTGPKGTLELKLPAGLELTQTDSSLTLTKTVQNPQTQAAYGLARTLVNNMVMGVSRGYERQLEINGVGYRASVSGAVVNLSLGFSHPVAYQLPAGITAKVEKNVITVMGHDKQAVGQVAANLRALKPPEPYKGKGIKYANERIRRKAGKTATKG
ncbi:MAG TPA: 50S ribosomal protein L6 [Candidatus Saccharimonadales bacterium]|nr:50S ribosomal protein L6 [Candidatus Saccharimonadales bacterium]